MKKAQSAGGIARAKNLSPSRRKEIAKKAASSRWEGHIHEPKPSIVWSPRDKIALGVLTGLYSNIADSQKFAAFAMGADTPIAEAFTRIAYEQADEVLRLRSL